MKYVLCAFYIACLIPQTAHAAVRITEVAWMGTAGSQYSEWLELYNDGEASVNLAGWKLYEGDGGALVFTLTKSIPANGYLLIERTTASAPDAVSGINDEAGSFGGGGFANTGEDLVLKDSSGNTADELDYTGGWPAGDATTKETMQLGGETWITAKATPKSGVGASSNNSSDENEEGSAIEELNEDPYPIPKVSPNKPGIIFTIPQTIYKGTAYQFAGEPVLEYNYRLNKGLIYWNFGDGTTLYQHEVAPTMHTYAYPGTYTIYYSYTDAITRNALTGIKKIKVLDPTLTIAMIGTTAIELSNTTNTAVDLSGWKVVANGRSLPVPPMTIVSEKSKAIIPLSTLGIFSATTTRIVDPSGNVVASTEKVAPVQTSSDIGSADVIEDPLISSDDLVASAAEVEENETASTPIRNRTKTIIFGAVALFVIGLSILLERVMARREYS